MKRFVSLICLVCLALVIGVGCVPQEEKEPERWEDRSKIKTCVEDLRDSGNILVLDCYKEVLVENQYYLYANPYLFTAEDDWESLLKVYLFHNGVEYSAKEYEKKTLLPLLHGEGIIRFHVSYTFNKNGVPVSDASVEGHIVGFLVKVVIVSEEI